MLFIQIILLTKQFRNCEQDISCVVELRVIHNKKCAMQIGINVISGQKEEETPLLKKFALKEFLPSKLSPPYKTE